MLLTTPEEYYETLTGAALNSDHGIVTSFGVFAGISFDGDIKGKYENSNPERGFFDAVAGHPDLSVVVGVHSYYSPSPQDICRHCIGAYTKRQLRIEKHREIFPNLHWYMLPDMHSKVAVFWKSDLSAIWSILGSRNMTGSPNHEVSYLMSNHQEATELMGLAEGYKSMATPVGLDVVMQYVADQTKGDYCFKVICGEG